MKKSLTVLALFFLTSHLSFAFQNVESEAKEKIDQVEFEMKFSDLRNFVFPRGNSKYKLSATKNISSIKDSPFLMLSAYIEKEDFDGNVFYQIETNEGLSEWLPFPKNNHGETPGRTVFIAGDIDSSVRTIQVKSDQVISEKFVLRLFAPGFSEEIDLSQTTSRSPENNCDCIQPPIAGRSDWCPSGNCPIDPTPFPTTPTHVIVHHSAGQTTSSDFAAVVRSYYDLHVNTNGWDDIGYNWLVDGNGVIYEGRGSGLQGAHFSCMNENTTGICVIGNYVNNTPTAAAIQALQDFIAWDVCDKNIEILDADLHVSSGLNLNNVSGHLDGNDSPNACSTTVCPGQNLYSLLEPIRNDVSLYPCLGDAVNVNTLLENEVIEIFPNPVQDYFQIKWENVTIKNIQIFDVVGRQVNYVNTLLYQQNQEFSLDADGIYFVKIELNDSRFFTKRIVVQN